MTQLTYDLPTIGEANATEDPDIRQALSQIKSRVNGQLDTDNLASDAGIKYSQLATLASGRIIIGSATNIATAKTVSGAVNLANTGATSLSGNIAYADGGLVTIGAAYAAMSGTDVVLAEAGAYRIACNLNYATNGTGVAEVEMSIQVNGINNAQVIVTRGVPGTVSATEQRISSHGEWQILAPANTSLRMIVKKTDLGGATYANPLQPGTSLTWLRIS